MRRRVASCFALVAAAASIALACATDEPRPVSPQPPLRVVMISLDGTRPADVRADTMPTLVRLALGGLWAERMRAARPTNTFPNHVTLVTGVAPERHGLVNNVFIDAERGLFEKRDIPAWIDVEPIWSRLERAGIPTASYHWVGSEGPWRSGFGPRHWVPFDKRTTEQTKVDGILAWLDLADPEQRPRLVTTWFHGADHAGHHVGPGSEAVAETLREQDAAIEQLVAGIESRGLRDSTLLVFVSDHGMSRPERKVDLHSLLADAGIEARVLGIGGFAGIHLKPSGDSGTVDRAAIDQVVAIGAANGLEVFPRDQAPVELRVANPRFGDAVALAPSGTAIVYPGLSIVGFHGYPPDDPEMSALFVASGAGIPPAGKLEVVRAIDIAPTLLALFGLEVPDDLEGSPIASVVTAVRAARAGAAASVTLATHDLLATTTEDPVP